AATSAGFIRVNVHVGTMATDQGVIEGNAAETLRARKALGAERVAIFADLMVKHATPIVAVDPSTAAGELRERGLADAILLTGDVTGSPADPVLVRRVRDATDAPVVVASGVSEENALTLAELADGFIVGTSIKENGVSDAPIDLQRAQHLVSLLK
ncbi:MAG: BtpA/SgcQ family protein, partial [Thermoanaerobaculia bacterium]|nr:BtpA/SgcQ family protein [Thermoanaerobaculia bacterium]